MSRTLEGFAFPFQMAGGVVRTRGFDKIAANVRHLLSTRLGERVMLRDYGGGVHHRLQEPNDETLQTLVRHEIEQALRTYIPEARLAAPIEVTFSGHEMNVRIEYAASPKDVLRRLDLQIPSGDFR